ncbi:MFS transporter [Enterococcus sp. LJL99]
MFKKRVGILSLSLVTGAATAVTTIIPLIAQNFPEQSLTSIESLITISSLSALVTILMNEFIVQWIGLKKTIIIGLLMGMIAGIAPFFFTSYILFYCTRILLGLGIGLYSPHAISLIALFYTGEQRNTLLGMQMGISALGNALLLISSGWLASFYWKAAFFVYLLLGVIALLIYIFVPAIKTNKKGSNQEKTSLSMTIKSYLLLCFITFLIIWGVQLKIPSFLINQGIESSKTAGMILSGMNIAGMAAGFLFGFVYKKIATFLLPVGFLGAALSVLGMINSSTVGAIFFFAVLFNFLYSFTGPTIVLKINQFSAENQLTKVNSLLTMTTILSSYAAPFVWNTITSLIDSSENIELSMQVLMFALIIMGLFLLLYFSQKKAKRKIVK